MLPEISSIIVTVVSGVLVFILGEILRDIWLTPLLQYKSVKQEISYTISYYACYFCNPIDRNENQNIKDKYCKASDNIRIVAAKLSGYSETLTFFKIGIPSKEKLLDASESLIAISNSVYKRPNNITFTAKDNILRKHKIIVDLKLNGYKESKKILDKYPDFLG